MREIIYRAKSIQNSLCDNVRNGDFVFGYLTKICTNNGAKYAIVIGTEKNCSIPILVDETTIGQFTGLTDKNGKKIFEGDILRGEYYPFKDDSGQYNYFAEVCWWDNCPSFGLYVHKNPKSKVNGISDGNTEDMEDWEPEQWEVIGNIYDNLELLGD